MFNLLTHPAVLAAYVVVVLAVLGLALLVRRRRESPIHMSDGTASMIRGLLGVNRRLTETIEAREAERVTVPPLRAGEVRSLRRMQWAVRVVLVAAVAASIAANILHAEPTIVGRVIAAWPPMALLATIELISRVPAHRVTLAWLRRLVTAGIAGIAGWVSYWHMVAVAADHGESASSAHMGPLTVDGLVIITSVCLVELAAKIRAAVEAAALTVETEHQADATTSKAGLIRAALAITGDATAAHGLLVEHGHEVARSYVFRVAKPATAGSTPSPNGSGPVPAAAAAS